MNIIRYIYQRNYSHHTRAVIMKFESVYFMDLSNSATFHTVDLYMQRYVHARLSHGWMTFFERRKHHVICLLF